MRMIATFALLALPTFGSADALQFDDGPWIAIPAGYLAPAMMSPEEEIRAMADLDGDASVTTVNELKMIVLLTQMLGTPPTNQ